MKRVLLSFAAIALTCMAMVGCSGGGDDSAGPTKVELDKGLEGKPAIDPNSSAPMGGGAGKLKGGP